MVLTNVIIDNTSNLSNMCYNIEPWWIFIKPGEKRYVIYKEKSKSFIPKCFNILEDFVNEWDKINK